MVLTLIIFARSAKSEFFILSHLADEKKQYASE